MAVAGQTMMGAPTLERVPPLTQRIPAQERPPALPALTGLRFVAAFSVVLSHWLFLWHQRDALNAAWFGGALDGRGTSLPVHLVVRALNAGGLAVTLFFLLSGFVLTYSYVTPAGQMRTSVRSFWGARAARIYPVYLLGLAVAAPPLVLWGLHASVYPQCQAGAPLPRLLATLTLTQAWAPASLSCLNGPAWSLSAEAFFYALFPLLVRLIGRAGGRGLLVRFTLCWALALAAPLCYLLLRPDGTADAYHAPWLAAVEYAPLLRLPEFICGMLAARLCLLAARRTPHAARHAWRGRLLLPAALGLLVLCYGVVPVALPQLANALSLPALALLVCALARRPLGRTGLLGTRPLRVLGESSYALYLLHWPLWLWVAHALGSPPVGAPGGGSEGGLFAGYLLLALSLSVVVWARVEAPARRALLALLCGPQPAPAPSPGCLTVASL